MDLPANFGKPWSEADLREIYQDLADARSVAESARALGRSEGEVVRKVREVAASMFMEGFMTKSAVAAATGLTIEQVDSAIREYDIMHRRPQETMRPHADAGNAGSAGSTVTATPMARPGGLPDIVSRERERKAAPADPLVHLAATISKSLKQITQALDQYIENYN